MAVIICSTDVIFTASFFQSQSPRPFPESSPKRFRGIQRFRCAVQPGFLKGSAVPSTASTQALHRAIYSDTALFDVSSVLRVCWVFASRIELVEKHFAAHELGRVCSWHEDDFCVQVQVQVHSGDQNIIIPQDWFLGKYKTSALRYY